MDMRRLRWAGWRTDPAPESWVYDQGGMWEFAELEDGRLYPIRDRRTAELYRAVGKVILARPLGHDGTPDLRGWGDLPEAVSAVQVDRDGVCSIWLDDYCRTVVGPLRGNLRRISFIANGLAGQAHDRFVHDLSDAIRTVLEVMHA